MAQNHPSDKGWLVTVITVGLLFVILPILGSCARSTQIISEDGTKYKKKEVAKILETGVKIVSMEQGEMIKKGSRVYLIPGPIKMKVQIEQRFPCLRYNNKYIYRIRNNVRAKLSFSARARQDFWLRGKVVDMSDFEYHLFCLKYSSGWKPKNLPKSFFIRLWDTTRKPRTLVSSIENPPEGVAEDTTSIVVNSCRDGILVVNGNSKCQDLKMPPAAECDVDGIKFLAKTRESCRFLDGKLISNQ